MTTGVKQGRSQVSLSYDAPKILQHILAIFIYLTVLLSFSNAINALCHYLLISCHSFIHHLYILVLLPHTMLFIVSILLLLWFFLPLLLFFTS